MSQNEKDDSTFVAHEQCPSCGSKDNLARYSDGHGYCFGCGHHEAGDGEVKTMSSNSNKGLMPANEYMALTKRHISEETCRKWGYAVGEMGGRSVQIANYRDDEGNVVAQKVRFPDKTFAFLGDPKATNLYGQHLWRDKGKMIVITEGEIDALSVSQLQGNKWPVVSLKNGAQGAKVCLKKALAWLEKFETVVLMFDNDEPGHAAAAECAQLFTPGRCKIATLPLKDANEMLVAGRGKEVVDAMWGAKEYRPDGLVSMAELAAEIIKPIVSGLPWFLKSLSSRTHGRRRGEVYTLGAGTGIGKTDFITQQIAFDVTELGETVGAIFLEQKPTETAKRIAGKIAGQRFHVPGAGWTEAQLLDAVAKIGDKVMFYDNFGETDWEIVKGHIRYMAVSLGVTMIYLDHLTAMADPSNERESLETLMKELAGLANELGLIVMLVSHLATPDGTPHEEGGRVMIRHFKGSRSIGFWSYFMIGLERDQQADDQYLRTVTTLRILKDRFTGQSTGDTVFLGYDAETGRLLELDHNPFEDGTKHGFKPQTADNTDF